MITFNHRDLSDDLAYIVENIVIQDAILKQLDKIKDRVSIQYDARVESYKLPGAPGPGQSASQADYWAQVKLASGETLHTRLLVSIPHHQCLHTKSHICNIENCKRNIL